MNSIALTDRQNHCSVNVNALEFILFKDQYSDQQALPDIRLEPTTVVNELACGLREGA